MSLIVEFLGSMTKCLNSKKVLRSNCMSSNSDDGNANSASKVAIRNRLKMEKKLERLSNLTKKLLDDLEEQEDINNNNNNNSNSDELGDYLYVHNFKHHQQHQQQEDNDVDNEIEMTKIHSNNSNSAKLVREFVPVNSENISLKECVVCLACPARIETMPCRHAVLCKRCFLRTIQTVIAQGTATLKCVLCRAKIIAINELEVNPRRPGFSRQPARSTDPIKPKFSKLQGGFPTVPCRSAVSLFRRSSRVQDLSNGASSPTPTFHSCSSSQQVRRKQDRTYHLLVSNNFEEQTT